MKYFSITLLTLLCCSQAIAQTTDSNTTLDSGSSTAVDTQTQPDQTENIAPSVVYSVTPGGILHIRSPKQDSLQYWAKLGQTRTIMIANATYDDIYAGIDINTIPGEYLVTLENKKKQIANFPFIVPVPNKISFSNTTPTKNSNAPLLAKEDVLKTTLWSNVPPVFPLIYPIVGDWSDTFGHYIETSVPKKRQQPPSLKRIDHLSLTVREPISVYSPSDAVCFSITFDENQGYTVLLDHGMGLFSELSGLTNLTISEQDRVTKSTLIGSFNTDDFHNQSAQSSKNSVERTVRWRVFLNKAVINPHNLINIQ